MADFESHLENDPDLKKELETFRKLREVTGAMKYADIPETVWENYWSNLYRKLERGFGWIFFSIGSIILLAVGGYYLIQDLFFDPSVPLIVKLGIGCGGLGLIILLVSVTRERIFSYKRDRYREVQR
jgi:hypothetical protein